MSTRTVAMRVRSGLALVLPVAAVLALAPAASAAGTIYENPATADGIGGLVSDINTAASGTTTVITLDNGTTYVPSSPMVVPSGANVELLADPQNQATGSTDTILNGQSVPPSNDMLTVSAGANFLLKGVLLQSGGYPGGFTMVRVYGNAEIDNSELDGAVASGLVVGGPNATGPAKAVISNSDITTSTTDAVESGAGDTLILNNDTIVDNGAGGVNGSATMNNTIVARNAGTGTTPAKNCFNGTLTATSSIDDDGSCVTEAGTGVSQKADTGTVGCPTGAGCGINLPTSPAFHGGPTQTYSLTTQSAAYNQGTNCLLVDQRFEVQGATPHCTIGSYQVGGGIDSSSPTCPASSQVTNYTSNPATDTVPASDAKSGFGPDSILPGEATTNNGTVTWPMLSSSQFDSTAVTTGADGFPSNDDLPATTFPVTASKPLNDTTVGDTKWSFTITSWAGISALEAPSGVTAADSTFCN